MNKKDSLMERVADYTKPWFLTLFIGLGLAGVIYLSNVSSNKRDSLIEKCIYKAAGKDHVLSSEEGIQMAKDFGFNGDIEDGGKVELIATPQRRFSALLKINNKIYSDEVPIPQMEDYLNGILKKKEQYQSKPFKQTFLEKHRKK
jgi:hypothetical protein